MMGVAAPARRRTDDDHAERQTASALHIHPAPEAVARLIASHGADVAHARWSYVGPRTLAALARDGRVRLGWEVPAGNGRGRSTPPDVELVLVAAAQVLGSGSIAERAAGDVCHGAVLSACHVRGLDVPNGLAHLKAARAAESRKAAAGDPDAIAAIAARHAHERAVYAVVRTAMPFAPEQTPTSPVRLPEPSAELVAALAGHDPAAVAVVFPDLDLSCVPQPKPEVAVEEQPVSQPARKSPRPRKAPSPEAIREACAATPAPTRMELAARWGLTPSGVTQALRRVGVALPHSTWGGSKPGRRKAKSGQVVALSLVPSVPAPASEPLEIATLAIPCVAGHPALMRPLAVSELAAAFELARLTGMDGRDALSWVRADLAMVKAEHARGQA